MTGKPAHSHLLGRFVPEEVGRRAALGIARRGVVPDKELTPDVEGGIIPRAVFFFERFGA